MSTSAQILALAGLLQSTYLVDQLARTGQAREEDIQPLFDSLFIFDADSPEAIYGGTQKLKLGLQILDDLLNASNTASYHATIRYSLNILYLQAKLAKRQDLLEIIRSRLQHTAIKKNHYSNNINEIAASIAAIYQDTVSTFNYRIEVNGSAQQLQNPANANMIRTLLLAAIRSSVLWRQSGGKRWHLLLARKRLRNCLRDML